MNVLTKSTAKTFIIALLAVAAASRVAPVREVVFNERKFLGFF